jgi:SAM-dependent methyltransferase
MDLVEVSSAAPARRHPWEEARFGFFAAVLGRAGLLRRGSRVLDVGAGDGWLALRLAEDWPGLRIACWDTGYDRGGVPAGWGTVAFSAVPPPGPFDLALLLDVAAHVEDDRGFVAGVVRDHVASGGHVLFSVPAWPALYSSHDARLRHHRRYAPRRARALLASAGLEILRAGGLFHSLLLPRAAQKLRERLVPAAAPARHAGEWDASDLATAAVRRALAWDARAALLFSSMGWDVPGLSWWALCRKP